MSKAVQRSLLVLALLAGLAVAVVLLRPLDSGSGLASPPSHPESANPSAVAPGSLRALLEGRSGQGARFEEVEALVRSLDDAELRALREEVGIGDRPEPVRDGLRCAVYAEWGRRDLAAALDHLRTRFRELSARKRSYYPVGSPWFSALRGWSEVDPESALAAIRDYKVELYPRRPADPRNWRALDGPTLHAARTASRTLTEREGATRWTEISALLPEVLSGRYSLPREILFGHLEGLPSRAGFADVLLAIEERVDTIKFAGPHGPPPAFRVWYGSYLGAYRVSLRQRFLTGGEVVRDVLAVYARHDWEDARRWAARLGPEQPGQRHARVQRLLRDWGRTSAMQAATALPGIESVEDREQVAVGILLYDPALAPPVLSVLPDAGSIEFVLTTAARTFQEGRVDESDPWSESGQLLRREESRFALMREAINGCAPLGGAAIEPTLQASLRWD